VKHADWVKPIQGLTQTSGPLLHIRVFACELRLGFALAVIDT
jgi:hypothetical protein